MPDLTTRIISILMQYKRDPAVYIGTDTTLAALDIDVLDLPMIFLDVEDTFNLYIPYEDDIEHVKTVAELVAWVRSRQEAQFELAQMRASQPRAKSTWLSTGSDRRR